MPIREEHSLIRYDPRQGLLGWRVEGFMRPAPSRTSAPPRPYENTAPGSEAGESLRQSQPHLMYSLRRTIEASAAGATGRIVDIFV